MNEKVNKVCNFCDFVFDTLLSRKALYGDISSYHPENPSEIKLGEIIGVNPNSYETIKPVLENLREQAGADHHLTWQILTTVLEAFARELIYIFFFGSI